MKKTIIFFAMLACAAFANCSKNDDAGTGSKTKFPKDVASAIKDIAFRQYCFEHFDANNDGVISKDEALGVNVIELSDMNIYSLAGLEYFTNLRELKCDKLKITEVDISNNSVLSKFEFNNCHELKNVKLSEKLNTIPYRAFYRCTSLPSITIPDSVKSIDADAFFDCTGLKSVTTGKGLMSIDDSAFSNCTNLEKFYGESASNDNYCLVLNGELRYIVRVGFPSRYTIQNGITSIGEKAFYYCNNLQSITIPDSVTSIGTRAFDTCKVLTNVVFGNGIKTIGECAFINCTGLTSVTIPDSVNSIAASAFSSCSGLTSVTIGRGVTVISSSAFVNCSRLQRIYCRPTTPPKLYDNSTFAYASLNAIYVPRASVSAYKAAQVWSEYASQIVGYDFE